jgi:peroxiredoxin
MEQLALQEIYPAIRKIGAQLACITPDKTPLPAAHPLAQVATQLGVGPAGEGRTFPVLWDAGNRVAELFGLTHDFSDATKGLYRTVELDLEVINGAEAGWTLPLASTYIIDKAGMIRHAVVTADWRIRPDPNDTLEKLKQAVADRE